MLTNNFDDSTVSATVHAAHHNALADHAQGGVAQGAMLVSGRFFPVSAFIATTTGVPLATPVATLCSFPAMTITQLSFQQIGVTTGNIEVFLYSNVAGNPNGQLGSYTITGSTATGFRTVTLGTPLVFADRTDIWVIARRNNTAGSITTSTYSNIVTSCADTLQGAYASSPWRSYTSITAGTTMPSDLSSSSYVAAAVNTMPIIVATVG